jgi:hypoxanthine phosphoribosyltransferase
MDNQTIKVYDKFFKKSIPFEELDKAIQHIADQLNRDLRDKNPLFLGILNGAFMFTAELFKKLDFPCEISFVKLASYSGTSSTEMVRQLIGFDEDIKGRTIVIIEDIVDTGLTMESILRQLDMMKAAEVKIATLLLKPEAFEGNYKVDYVGLEISNDFIVGFGLDYNKHGRNYKDIYKIVEQ